MSLTLPSELAWVLNMLGFMWPEADEDKLRASAQAWRDFGAELVRVNQNARLVAAQVSTENSADSIDSFDRFWHGVGGRGGDFDRAKEAADHMATALDLTAGLVEGVKVAIIAQLGLLAAEIIVDQVAAPVTLGLSEGAMVGEVILTRVIVRRIIQEGIHKVGHEVVHSLKGRVLDLFRRILATAVRRALVGATVAGGMDVAKQEADVHIFHSRTQLDLTEVGLATGTGLVLGAVVPARPKTRSPGRNLSRLDRGEGSGTTPLKTAYHYGSSKWAQSITDDGLHEGTYATPTGDLSPLQATIELALPPNRSHPDIVVRIDLAGLRESGSEIPEVTRVGNVVGDNFNVVTHKFDRVYSMPGGGWEMHFPYPIPPEFVEVIKL